MADYKRLITYAYSYESGSKKHNVGHARVEVYGSALKVKVNIKVPSYSEKVLKLYFYKRVHEGLKTSYLCEVNVLNGCVDENFQTKTDSLGDSGLQFHELEGFVLYLNPAKCIVFDLKDQILTNEEIHTIEPVKRQVKESIKESVVNSYSDSKQEKEFEYSESHRNADNRLQENYVETVNDVEQESKPEPVNETTTETGNEQENTNGINNPMVTKDTASLNTEYNVQNSRKMDNKVQTNNDYNPSSMSKDIEIIKSIASKILKNADATSSTDDVAEQTQGRGSNNEAVNFDHNENEHFTEVENSVNSEVAFPWRDSPEVKRILNGFPRVYPFEDGEIAECVKIEPKDIGLLPMQHWSTGNNSFLLHGYNNYHHLLFAKKQTRAGCLYLLMVPGVYNAREKYMARLFGFEYFKCAKRRNLREGEFGYWYLTIQF